MAAAATTTTTPVDVSLQPTLRPWSWQTQPQQGKKINNPTLPPAQSTNKTSMVSGIPLPHIPVAGRLKFFIDQWKCITTDCEIMDIVYGMHIDPNRNTTPEETPLPIPFSEQECKFMDNHITELLSKKVITKTHHEKGEFVSTVFLRPKLNGKFHMILNLKKFNWFVEYNKFKMDTLQFMLTWLRLFVSWAWST